MSNAYQLGKHAARLKLGFAPKLLGGAALGALAGYTLAPEDRKGKGALLGAGLTGAGAALGHKFSPYLLDAGTSQFKNVAPTVGTALGGLAGLGLSQAFIDKKTPDTSEDPYRYSVR